MVLECNYNEKIGMQWDTKVLTSLSYKALKQMR